MSHWYRCPNCGTTFSVDRILRSNLPSSQPHHCIDCGGLAPAVIGTDDQWWLTMEQTYKLPRELLETLLQYWHQDTKYSSFTIWLENFQKEN